MNNIGVGTFVATQEMYDLVQQVLDSGRISYGPLCRQFEAQFASLHDVDYAVLSNSGTSSLQVAIQAAKELHGWQDGDQVIIPATTFVATVNAVLHSNLVPVLVDVEINYYGIDCTQIAQAITNKTRAIIPVHPFGQPCDMRFVTAIADYHDLVVIEDSCEAMFVCHHDRPVGSWGEAAAFSTYVAHLLTTGVGGISLTNDPDLADVMRSLVNHGITQVGLPEGKAYDASWLSRRFQFDRIGHSFRITELEAALGLAQLDGYDCMLYKRKSNAQRLTRNLSRWQNRIQTPARRPDTDHAYMMYALVMRDEDKGPIRAHLAEHGIETRDMLPLTNQPCYDGLFDPARYPIARWINDSGFYVGIHQALTGKEIDFMAGVIGGYFERR